MGKVTIAKNFSNTTLFSGESFTAASGPTSSAELSLIKYNEILFYAQADTGTAGLAATLTAEISPDGTNFFAYNGFVSQEKDFTNAALFSGENFTSTANATSSALLDVSRFDEVTFYADCNLTGAAALASTITAEVSPDGTNFFAYQGFLPDNNTHHTGVSFFTLNTGTSEIFSMKNLGGIQSMRFTLTMVNQIPSTSVNLRYAAKVSKEPQSSITLNTASTEIFSLNNLGAINSIRFTLSMANNNPSTTVDLRYAARTEDDGN